MIKLKILQEPLTYGHIIAMKLLCLIALTITSFCPLAMAERTIVALYWSMKIEGQVKMRQGLEDRLIEFNKNEPFNANKIKLKTFVAGEGSAGVMNQRKQFLQAIAMKPDLIIVQPTDSSALSDIAQQANQQNIPLITYDQHIVNARLESIITSDNYKAGWDNAIYAHNILPKNKNIKIVLFEYNRVSATVTRLEGFLDALRASNRKFEVLKSYEAVDPESGKKAIEQFAKDFPKKFSVDLIFTVNDGGGNIIVENLKKLGRNEITHTSVDGDESAIRNIKNQNISVSNSGQHCNEIGKSTMNIAIDFLNLKSIDKRYLVPTFLIHKNNISEYNIWLKKSPSKSQQKNLYSHQTAKFEQKKFKIAVASLCPYICVKDKVWTGYIHDLLISFAKIHNLKLEFIDTPTERLRHSLNKLEADMIISTSGNLRYFSDIQMFGKSLGVSYAGLMYKYNKSKNFYTSLEDLRKKNIGFSPPSFAQIKDEIVNLDFKTTNISGNNASSRLFKMFEVNRLDYIVDDYQILSYLSKNNKNYKIQAMSILGYNNLGLASKIDNSEAKHFAFGFSNYIENLRRTGNLNRYLKKYAIKDWSEISFH